MDYLDDCSIAVISMSCRFPAGANDPTAFWSMLSEGKSGWSKVPGERFNEKAFNQPVSQSHGTIHHHGGHFLDQDISAFDAAFFGISPSEASAMDPQHRVQLECAYEAFEGAGIRLEDIKGSNTAVYMATFSRDYDRMMFKDTSDISMYHLTGAGEAILSNRISYLFDFKGPSITLDTGCSGGLVALHQACQSLRTRETDMALVGGANLILSPDAMIPMSRSNILNGDGRCYPFDTRGRGYGRGEGTAAILLKRLDDAKQEAYRPRAIIRNTGVNQDGKTQGISVPSSSAQQDLIASVYKSCAIDPQHVTYVEAHGTGTEVGDAAEMQTIAGAFCGDRRGHRPLYVGSAKSNIGHLESASGLAGLIKAVLILENEVIPPNYDLREVRKNAKWQEFGIQVANSNILWPKDPSLGARYISVNSFGYGGTNAHCVLEGTSQNDTNPIIPSPILNSDLAIDTTKLHEAQRSSPRKTARSHSVMLEAHGNVLSRGSIQNAERNNFYQAFPVTAKSKASLQQAIMDFSRWLLECVHDDRTFCNLAYTLSSRRSLLPYRYTLVASDFKDLAAALKDAKPSLERATSTRPLTFIFTGQGAQWYAMGRELLYVDTVFTSSLSTSAHILKNLGASWNLLEELKLDPESSRISRSEIAQPATIAVQIALVELLASLGIRPQTVIGHSSGEIAAAYAAGALDQTAALRVAFNRGLISTDSLARSSPKGGMLVVGLSELESFGLLSSIEDGYLTVACANSDTNTTIAGDQEAIIKLQRLLNDKDIFSRRLQVDLPYHSNLIRAAVPGYLKALEGLHHSEPQKSVEFISTVTAKYKRDGFGPSYWIDNLVSKVDFLGALRTYKNEKSTTLESGSLHVFLEVGPHNALQICLRDTFKIDRDSVEIMYLSALIRGHHAIKSVSSAAAKMFDVGINVDLGILNLAAPSNHRRSVLKDLPRYAWDHSQLHWHESRLSLEHRQRQFAPHEVLGVLIVGNCTYERIWSNKISIGTHPWMGDHVIDSCITFPGAAYLCMAVEAIEQVLANHSAAKEKLRYVFRDVRFVKALILPHLEAEVEVQFKLSQSQPDASRSLDGQWNFHVYSSQPNGDWSENCQGSIIVEFPLASQDVQVTKEEELQSAKYRDQLAYIDMSDKDELNEEELYQRLATKGNAYGKSFALLENVKVGNEHATGEVIISNTMSPVFHPATLDALIHLVFPVFARHSSATSIVPVRSKEAFISTGFPRKTGQKILVATTVNPHGPQTFTADVLAFDANGETKSAPVLGLSLDFQAIGDDTQIPRGLESDGLAWEVQWAPDVNYLAPSWLECCETILPSGTDITPERKHAILNQCAAHYISSCLDDLSGNDYSPGESHVKHLVEWMKQFAGTSEFRNLANEGTKPEDLDLSLLGVEAEAISQVGNSLASIIKEETNPLEMLLKHDLLYRVYNDDSSSLCSQRLAQYVKLLAFKQPQMTILEIGAGTGSTTLPLLKVMTKSNSTLFEHYDFTDIAPSFLEAAQELLKPWVAKMSFRPLNIEQDPQTQGFREGTYDLIIAANVLHATSSIDSTLRHVRRLLKPGGKLALIELTASVPYINLTAGTLPGWWKGYDDGRTNGPHLTVAQWDSAFLKHELTGVEMSAPDFTGQAHKADLMITGATVKNSPDALQVIILHSTPDIANEEILAQSILDRLQASDCTVVCSSWQNERFETDAVYLVMDRISEPLLVDVATDRFRHITKMMTRCSNAFWVVLPGNKGLPVTYEAGLVTGLSRTARSENESLKLVTLDASCSLSASGEQLTDVITNVLLHTFGAAAGNSFSSDVEFEFKDDEIRIPRLIAHAPTNMILDPDSRKSLTKDTLIQDWDRPLKLQIMSPGVLQSLRFVDDSKVKEAIGDDDLEINAEAYGVNFKDVFIALGQMPADTPMAGECVGTVTAVGPNMLESFSLGDRVCALGSTPYASRPRVSGFCAARIPNDMSSAIGASVPVVFVTAYHCIVNVARLQAKQTILIHAASGGVGQAAIIIAQYIGAEIFATVGSSDKREKIQELYHIPATHIFSSRTSSFKKSIMRITRGTGVNAVLNSASGQILLDTWDCMSTFGVFVEIGKRDIYRNNHIPLHPFDKNVTFASVDLTLIARHQPTLIRSILSKVLELLKNGDLRPISPITALPICDVEGAFRMIQNGSHIGKLILEAPPGSLVKSIPTKPDPVKLDHCGTYVIAGGLGALGLQLCDFLARRGAGSIVILSRRSRDEKAQILFESLKKRGSVITHLACDISKLDEMEKAALNIRKNLPPVKGVFQAAMVLNDAILEQMTAEDLNMTVHCKTVGTSNLFECFGGSSLEFFVMLSSLASIIGNRAQGNYAAANGYLDNFAQTYNSKGTAVIAINLGFIADSETISAHQSRVDNISKAGCVPLSLEQMLSVLELAISPRSSSDQPRQLAVGVNGHSLSQGLTKSLQRSLFDHLRHSYKGVEASRESIKKDTITEIMANSRDTGQLRIMIADAVAKQLSSVLASKTSELPLDTPLADLGLDSLAAVELKNWISRTLQAALQTGEILDCNGIQHVADLVIQRSRLISRKKQAQTNEIQSHREESRVLDSAKSAFEPLPALPLPSLIDTLNLYKESVSAFCSNSELQTLEQHIAEFLESGALGDRLQGQLTEKTQDTRAGSWLHGLFTNFVYLRPRASINPTQTYFGSHFDGTFQQSQAERAGIITKAILEFKETLDRGCLEQDFLFDKALCMKSLDFIFNAVREPHKGVDRLQKYSQRDYAIVIKVGHYFQIDLHNDAVEKSQAAWIAAFESICTHTLEPGSSIATLTTADRDTWAEARELLLDSNPEDAELLRTIERAAFVICLDEGHPSSATERHMTYLYGDPLNRWKDKSVQFVVCKNGSSAYVCDHAGLEGGTLAQLNKVLQRAISKYHPERFQAEYDECKTSEMAATVKASPVRFTNQNPVIERYGPHAARMINSQRREVGVLHYTWHGFGSAYLHSRKCAPKSGFQLLIQLASLKYFGYQPPSWEPVQLRTFQEGRTDMYQAVLPSVAAFCTAMLETSTKAAEGADREQQSDSELQKRGLFDLAAKQHSILLNRVARGHGFNHHLAALHEMALSENGEALPALLMDPLLARTRPVKLMTDCAEWLKDIQDGGMAMPDPEFVWVHYEIQEHTCKFLLHGPAGKVEAFAEKLDEAGTAIKALLSRT